MEIRIFVESEAVDGLIAANPELNCRIGLQQFGMSSIADTIELIFTLTTGSSVIVQLIRSIEVIVNANRVERIVIEDDNVIIEGTGKKQVLEIISELKKKAHTE